MPDLLKRKLSEEPVAGNLLPRDRFALVRHPLDQADASQRNPTAGIAAVRAALGVPVLYTVRGLTDAQGMSGGGVVPGVLYAIVGDVTTKWNAVAGQPGSGTLATILVEGLENYFDVEGTRLDADGVPVEQVQVNVAAGTYAALNAGAGTVKTVNGLAPDAAGNVTLPQRDVYAPQSDPAEMARVKALFTTTTQAYAADATLTDATAPYGSRFFDKVASGWYELFPDTSVPDPAGHATPTWGRTL